MPSAGCRLSKARTTGCRGRSGRRAPPGSKENSPVSSTSSSRCSDDRRRHHVVARPEVGRGGGDADESAAAGHTSKTARSTALRSFSQLTTAGALPSAVSGSLRPWPVSTQTTDLGRRGALGDRQAVGEQAGDRGGRGGLAEDAFAGGEPAVGVEDLLVGDGGDAAARGGEGVHRLLPARRVADPDRRGDGLRLGDRGAVDQRRRALGLEAVEDRRRAELLEAAPVGGDVAGVADRDRQRPGRLAELLDDLEGGRLLALDPVGVDRVDELDRVLLGELADDLSASSKLPCRAMTRAPCISAWASLPIAILPSGTITAPRRPARAA